MQPVIAYELFSFVTGLFSWLFSNCCDVLQRHILLFQNCLSISSSPSWPCIFQFCNLCTCFMAHSLSEHAQICWAYFLKCFPPISYFYCLFNVIITYFGINLIKFTLVYCFFCVSFPSHKWFFVFTEKNDIAIIAVNKEDNRMLAERFLTETGKIRLIVNLKKLWSVMKVTI